MAGFATHLRYLRKERNLRQKDLAAELGLAQTTIANYEQDTRFPDEEILTRIVSYFDTSLDYLLGRSEVPHPISAPRSEAATPELPISELGRSYVDALLAAEVDHAADIVLGAARSGMSTSDLYLTLLAPALKEVGRLWETSKASVYEEHIASEATLRIMARLMERAPRASRRPDGPVGIFAVVYGEQHSIGLRMVSDLFEVAGWTSIFLGMNTPTADIVEAIEEHDAALLAISATMSYHLNAVSGLIDSVRSVKGRRGTRVLVGGLAFAHAPELWRQIGADGAARDAGEAVALADRLIHGDAIGSTNGGRAPA